MDDLLILTVLLKTVTPKYLVPLSFFLWHGIIRACSNSFLQNQISFISEFPSLSYFTTQSELKRPYDPSCWYFCHSLPFFNGGSIVFHCAELELRLKFLPLYQNMWLIPINVFWYTLPSDWSTGQVRFEQWVL